MRTNWISRLATKYGRFGAHEPRNRTGERDVDARRIRSELDAIRVRFSDHA